MGKQIAPMTPGLVTAVLGSGLMVSATVMIAVLHAIMFGSAHEALGSERDASAALYLWIGTAEAASTAWAAVVLYRLSWSRLTPGRVVVVAMGAASTLLAVGLWIAFWSAR